MSSVGYKLCPTRETRPRKREVWQRDNRSGCREVRVVHTVHVLAPTEYLRASSVLILSTAHRAESRAVDHFCLAEKSLSINTPPCWKRPYDSSEAEQRRWTVLLRRSVACLTGLAAVTWRPRVLVFSDRPVPELHKRVIQACLQKNI